MGFVRKDYFKGSCRATDLNSDIFFGVAEISLGMLNLRSLIKEYLEDTPSRREKLENSVELMEDFIGKIKEGKKINDTLRLTGDAPRATNIYSTWLEVMHKHLENAKVKSERELNIYVDKLIQKFEDRAGIVHKGLETKVYDAEVRKNVKFMYRVFSRLFYYYNNETSQPMEKVTIIGQHAVAA